VGRAAEGVVQIGSSTMTAVAAVVAWLAVVFVGLVHAAGGSVPQLAVLACAVVGAPIALAAAGHALGSMWRGPTIIAFGLADSTPCSADEASYVRQHAQLRGTMGGAGFLYPRRLVLVAMAWLAAAVLGLSGLSEPVCDTVGPWAVAASLTTAFAAFLLPARPYFYRDTTGGGAVLSPPSAAYRLMRRAEIAQALALGAPVESATPAPTPAPPALTPSRLGPPANGA
jgi:hypothetical protein